MTEIASEYGYLRGTRLDGLPRYERADVSPAFIDMHWEDPDFDRLLSACRRHEPAYAIAGDYNDEGNHEVVNDRARQLRSNVENVIVVPHHRGDIEHVPEWATIGYSTPSDYAATEIPLREYRDARQPIHILGGTPHQQHELLGRLWLENVQSLDCNSHHKAATIGAKAWYPGTPHWRQVPEGKNRVVRAYRTSVENLHDEHQQRGLA